MTEETTTPIVAYKGFDQDLKCRGMQYTVGETAIHEGEVSPCNSGLHACEYPLDILRYYAPAQSRFAEVEQSGKIAIHAEDSKVASSRLRVKIELSLARLIKAAVDYTFRKALPIDPKSPASATGYSGAASATGDSGAASATGYSGAASALGEKSAAMASGARGKVRGIAGTALFLVYRDPITGAVKHAWSGLVGKKGVKADTWYTLTSRGRIKQVKE